MGQGEGLVDIVHMDGDDTRRLREVLITAEDEWGFTLKRTDGSVIRIAKRFVVRVEPAGNGSRGGQRGY